MCVSLSHHSSRSLAFSLSVSHSHNIKIFCTSVTPKTKKRNRNRTRSSSLTIALWMLDWGKCARVSVLARAHTLLSFYFNLYIPTYFTRLLIYFFCFTLKHLHVAKRQIHYRPRHMRYIRIQSPKNNTISIWFYLNFRCFACTCMCFFCWFVVFFSFWSSFLLLPLSTLSWFVVFFCLCAFILLL